MAYNVFGDGGFLDAVTQIFAKLKGLFDRKADTILGTHYGACSTAAATAAKTVTIDGITELTEGLKIIVKFANAQTYNGAPTLNVNGLGDKNIKRQGTTNAARYEWSAGELIELVYDGTYWVMLDGALATTSYYGVTKLTTSATSTSTTTALTPAALNSLVLNMMAGYPIYSTSATYDVGDRVRYNYQVWECVTAITTAEAWTAAHWAALDTIMELLDGKYVKPSGGIPASDLASGVIPSASSSTPLEDGTASAGSSADYAKGDHRHPHDTSKQDTLVSGTNIKTVNGQSVLGEGNLVVSGLPVVTSSDNGKVPTVVSGAWALVDSGDYNVLHAWATIDEDVSILSFELPQKFHELYIEIETRTNDADNTLSDTMDNLFIRMNDNQNYSSFPYVFRRKQNMFLTKVQFIYNSPILHSYSCTHHAGNWSNANSWQEYGGTHIEVTDQLSSLKISPYQRGVLIKAGSKIGVYYR